MKQGLIYPAGILLSFASLAIFSVADNIRGPIYPDILHLLNIEQGRGSLYFLATSLAAITTQWCFPALLASTNRFYLIYAVFLLLFIGSGLVQWQGMAAHNWPTLLLGAGLFGVALGGTSIVHGILLKNSVDPFHQARAFSFLHAIYGGASLVSPLLVSQTRVLWGGWQNSILVPGVLALMLLTPFWLFANKLPPLASSQVSPKPQSPTSVLTDLYFMLLAASLSLVVAAEVLLSTRLVLFLREHRGYQPAEAEARLALFFLFLLLGRVMGGYVQPQKIAFDRLSVLLVGLLLVTLGLGFMGIDRAFCVAGLWIGPLFPLGMAELSQRKSEDFTKYSSYLYVGVGIAILSMHTLFGLTAKSFGLTEAMALSLAFTALALAGHWELARRQFR